MFSVTDLLQPVSAAQPCGADLAFSSELDAINRARLHDDPTLAQGAWVAPLKEADWVFVASRCAELITATSKDLRLAVWLAEAQAKTRQLRGLGDGYAVLAGLCAQFWDALYPSADEGDYEQRIGNLYWLLSRSPQLLGEMALTEGAGSAFSLRDFAAARQRAARQGAASEPGWGTPERDLADGPALAELEAARRANSHRFNAALQADAAYCLEALQQLEAAVDARLGASGPGFSVAKEALQDVLHFIGPVMAPAPTSALALDQTALADAPSGEAGGTSAAAGALRNRVQALAQLRQVADFFRRTEPHSPVAYLADKAAHWGELPLHLWLRAVVKDAAALGMLEDLLGSAAAGDTAA